MTHLRTPLFLATLVLFLALTPSAHAVSEDLAWVGLNGYTMTGTFSYNDALIGTGPIDETQIDTLTIEGFRYGTSVGTWDLADGLGTGAEAFNFNFDTTTNEFVVGGDFDSAAGQAWNLLGDPGLGFLSQFNEQGLSLNGSAIFDSFLVGSTLALGTLDQFTSSSFNIEWIGENGYSMEGMFSFWDVLDDGVIDESALKSFMIEGFLNATTIGTWDLADGLGTGAEAFNFNFDTTTNEFVVGGDFDSAAGQAWNLLGDPGLGFLSQFNEQGLSLNGSAIFDSFLVGSILTGTPKAVGAVPEPSSLLLLGSGLAGLAGWRWRKNRAATS